MAIEIEHFLELVTKNELKKSEAIAFYDIVKGIIPDLLGDYEGYRIVHKHDKYHRYYIPLTDDLADSTDDDIVDSIMTLWDEVYDGKYFIETSTVEDEEAEDNECNCPCNCGASIDITAVSVELGSDNDPTEYVNQLNPAIMAIPEIDINQYSNEISLAVAKYQHKKWMEEKLKEGWKYSTEYDFMKKQHPLLTSWEQLPVEYQETDNQFVSTLSNILDGMGLQITRKNS